MKKSSIKPGLVAFIAGDFPTMCHLVSECLIRTGITKIYVATQTSATKPAVFEEWGAKIVPVELNPLLHSEIKAIAKKCLDVNLLFNLVPAVSGRGRSQVVNRGGALDLNLAFAPVIAANGGGVIINAIPQASQLQLQLNAIAGKALEKRNIQIHFEDVDLQYLFLQSQKKCQRQLASLLTRVQLRA